MVSAKSSEGLETAFARIYSEEYLKHWATNQEFSMIKIIAVGDRFL